MRQGRTRNPACLWETPRGTWNSGHIPQSQHWPVAVWPPGWLLQLLALARALSCLAAALLCLLHSWQMKCCLLIPVALSCLQVRTLNSWSEAPIAALESLLNALVYPTAYRHRWMARMPQWSQAPSCLLSHCPSPAHPIPLPLQAAGWGPWLLLSSPWFLLRGTSVCFPRMGPAASSLPLSPKVLAGHMLRRIRVPTPPRDTSAAGSMTSQPQALVTGETEASHECLSSGRKETNRACLCEGQRTRCLYDCTEF